MSQFCLLLLLVAVGIVQCCSSVHSFASIRNVSSCMAFASVICSFILLLCAVSCVYQFTTLQYHLLSTLSCPEYYSHLSLGVGRSEYSGC